MAVWCCWQHWPDTSLNICSSSSSSSSSIYVPRHQHHHHVFDFFAQSQSPPNSNSVPTDCRLSSVILPSELRCRSHKFTNQFEHVLSQLYAITFRAYKRQKNDLKRRLVVVQSQFLWDLYDGLETRKRLPYSTADWLKWLIRIQISTDGKWEEIGYSTAISAPVTFATLSSCSPAESI